MIGLFVVALSACDDSDGFTATKTFNLTLSGGQSVPINDSEQTALATVELDENTNALRAVLSAENIEGLTMAHIHSGDIGETGGVVFGFDKPTSFLENVVGYKEGQLIVAAENLSASQVEDLLAGEWYINVHTTKVPSGELRAQIVPSSTTILTFKLDGEQAVPAVNTTADGDGYLAYDGVDNELSIRLNTRGVDDPKAAHIHAGRIGDTSGGVIVGLNAVANSTTAWEAENRRVEKEDFQNMLSGGYHVNVHAGDKFATIIRGHIFSPDYKLFTFPLTGDQEEPPVTTAASGAGYALLNTVSRVLELKVVTQKIEEQVPSQGGVNSIIMAHIHKGIAGENGPPVVTLEEGGSNAIWQTKSDQSALTSEQAADFIDGKHYVNIHTKFSGAGELRGQIEP